LTIYTKANSKISKCVNYPLVNNGGYSLNEIPKELKSRAEVLLKFEKYLKKENLINSISNYESKLHNGFPIFLKKVIITEKAYAIKLSNNNTQVI